MIYFITLLIMALYGQLIYGQCSQCEAPLTVWVSMIARSDSASQMKRIPARMSMTWTSDSAARSAHEPTDT
jgi:hypothetical protein